MPSHRVLIIEDEVSLANVLKYRLEAEGFEVSLAHTGEEGLAVARRLGPDAIILDWMLPGLDGAEVCKRLRAGSDTANIPILMLTARTTEQDEVEALAMGADDYVAKPFRMLALVQRIKRLVGRSERIAPRGAGPGDVLTSGDLVLDRRVADARLPHGWAKLTATEFKILWVLVQRAGETFTRHELLDATNGPMHVTSPRAVDAHIKAIRRKLGPYGQLIETVWGVGYRFRGPEQGGTGKS